MMLALPCPPVQQAQEASQLQWTMDIFAPWRVPILQLQVSMKVLLIPFWRHELWLKMLPITILSILYM
jgi:hypothetical protein